MKQSLNIRAASAKSAVLASCSIAALWGGGALAQTASSASASGAVIPSFGNIAPFFGNIAPFSGNIGPSFGNIAPFFGNIAPFSGTVAPSYGNIAPFGAGAAKPSSPFFGDVSSFWGGASPFDANTTTNGKPDNTWWAPGGQDPFNQPAKGAFNFSSVGTFWKTEGTSWITVSQAWQSARTSADYAAVAKALQSNILSPASAFWTPVLPAAAPSGPGQNAGKLTSDQQFNLGFASTYLAKAGVTLNSDGSINASSLAAATPTQQAMFLLGLYDGLMSYTGAGHVDWWMGAVHWSQSLATSQGSIPSGGTPPTVGMLDFTAVEGKHTPHTLTQYGSTVFNDGHGAAVASLIMGAVDGSGVMGVVPQNSVNVVVYDPYDSTGTTNWTSIGQGIVALSNLPKQLAPVSVINASLGVAGWTFNPGWNTALSQPGAAQAAAGKILVTAAGNDGVTQTANVPWNFAANPALLIVGSIGADGTISNFSNRPGEACLLDTASTATACADANKLKSRFIVAPGELVLVSDGNGGTTRVSGTSVAAPLVSGAIELLQNRWPWLRNFPNETASIILKSATPLGAQPGADATYGVGLLNVQASQSPLKWSNLVFYSGTPTFSKSGQVTSAPVPISSLVSQVAGGSQAAWNQSNLYFSAFETVGNTYRDFEIPLSSKLIGQQVATIGGNQQFQSFLTASLQSWVAGGAHFAAADPGLASFMATSTSAGRVGSLELRVSSTPAQTPLGYRASGVTANSELALIGKTTTFRAGVGQGGAAALDGSADFTQSGDYDVNRGGANPLLGLASGGAFATVRTALSPRWAFSAGIAARRDARDLTQYGVDAPGLATGATYYTAEAGHASLDFRATDRLTLKTGFTRLHENTGLLGVQSVDPNDLRHGSDTTAANFGAELALAPTLSVSVAGSLGSTTTGAGQALQTTDAGLRTSSAEFAISKLGVFGRNDRLRLALSKPMQVDGGQLRMSGVGVVDRTTGALGLVSQLVSASSNRTPYAVDLLYGRLLPKFGEISLFTHVGDTDPGLEQASPRFGASAGAKYRITF